MAPQPPPGGRGGGRVPVDAEEASGGKSPGDLQRMAGAAERAVQIEAFRTDGESFQTLPEKNGAVAVFHGQNPKESSMMSPMFSGVSGLFFSASHSASAAAGG